MKNYKKPALTFAAATLSGAGGCLQKVDMDLIIDILGPDVEVDKIFGMQEACEVNVPIDYYCKFTSVELGSAQGFLS